MFGRESCGCGETKSETNHLGGWFVFLNHDVEARDYEQYDVKNGSGHNNSSPAGDLICPRWLQ